MSEQMPKAKLGTDGPEITRVGLGAWAIGGPWRWGWGSQDDRRSIATIHRAVASGIDWIDTAAVYGFGHSEEVVGRALAELPADERPLVFTKCGMQQIGESADAARVGAPAWIRQDCEESLRRLGVEAIDLLQLHWPPEDGTPIEASWETLAELRGEGKIRLAGVSNVSVEQLESLAAIAPVDSVQPPLSLINRDALGGVLPWCERSGTGVIVYSPMQSGLLTGKYDRAAIEALGEGDWRRQSPDFVEPGLARNLALVDRLRELAGELGAGLPELAVAWTLAQPGVSGAIVGARRPEQPDSWIGAGALELDAGALGRIDDAIVATGAGEGPRAF
ncbi:MAG: aldo/keto reductase [Actinobacteria bacterium]|nr:aldo/keto reductase [Actinomycetota bacterium]